MLPTLTKQQLFVNCMWVLVGCLFIEGTNSCAVVDFTRKPNTTEGYPFHFWERGCHYIEWQKEGSLIRTIANGES